MLIYVKIKKKMFFIGQTDRQTHGQLKTIVRNLTIMRLKRNNSQIIKLFGQIYTYTNFPMSD